MTKHLHTYDAEYDAAETEGNVIPGLEVRFRYTFTPGRPAQISGPPENCYDAEGPEIEVSNIHTKLPTLDGGWRWFDATPTEFDLLLAWAEAGTVWEAMVEEAIDELAIARLAAHDAAWEERRDLERMEDG